MKKRPRRSMLQMSPRTIPFLLLMSLLIACSRSDVSSVSDHASLANDATSPPNFIILFPDDLGWADLAAFGSEKIRTPNLDTLAREGQRWSSFYVAAPVCSPSRGALLTGRYPVRTGLYGRRLQVLYEDDPLFVFPDSEVTIAELLGDAGYSTAIVGKWHLGDRLDSYPTRHGFDYWWGIPYSNDMPWTDGPPREEYLMAIKQEDFKKFGAIIRQHRHAFDEPRIEYWNPPLIRSQKTAGGFTDTEVERPIDQRTFTERLTAEAVDFITAHQSEPFFLYVAYTKPHIPLFPGKDFNGRSGGGRYGDAVEEIDWSTGQIINTLRRLELDRRTLVIFVSDNGPWLEAGEDGGSAIPFRGGKGTTFEGGMRVPAIFWGPENIMPGEVAGIGSVLDILPTFAAAAGIATDHLTLDGLDLGATLLDPPEESRDSIAYYAGGELQAYRKDNYKLVLVNNRRAPLASRPNQRLSTPKLYDLHSDPEERHDVADTHPDLVDKLLSNIGELERAMPIADPMFDTRLSTL